MPKPREERHRCCVCGSKRSKTWTPLKGKCEACSPHCAGWSEANAPDICPFHNKRP